MFRKNKTEEEKPYIEETLTINGKEYRKGELRCIYEWLCDRGKHTVDICFPSWLRLKEIGYTYNDWVIELYKKEDRVDPSQAEALMDDLKYTVAYDAEKENIMNLYRSGDTYALALLANSYKERAERADAELALRERKPPLTKEEFQASEYQKYLDDYNKETEELKKQAKYVKDGVLKDADDSPRRITVINMGDKK